MTRRVERALEVWFESWLVVEPRGPDPDDLPAEAELFAALIEQREIDPAGSDKP